MLPSQLICLLMQYWPSQLGGKSRVLTPKGNFKHLAALLLPSHGKMTECRECEMRLFAWFICGEKNNPHISAFSFWPGTRAKWGQEKSAKPDLVDVLRAAQKHFKQVKGRDLTKDELPKLVAAIKGARFVGNHVYAGSDEGVLKFQ